MPPRGEKPSHLQKKLFETNLLETSIDISDTKTRLEITASLQGRVPVVPEYYHSGFVDLTETEHDQVILESREQRNLEAQRMTRGSVLNVELSESS